MKLYVGQEMLCVNTKGYKNDGFEAHFTVGKCYVITKIGGHERLSSSVVWTLTDLNVRDNRLDEEQAYWTNYQDFMSMFIPLNSLEEEDIFQYKLSGVIPDGAIERAKAKL